MKKLPRNNADNILCYNLGVGKESLKSYVCLSKQHLQDLKRAAYINNVGFIYACKLIYKAHNMGVDLQSAYNIIFCNIGAFNTDYTKKTYQGAVAISNYFYNCTYYYYSLNQARAEFKKHVFNTLFKRWK